MKKLKARLSGKQSKGDSHRYLLNVLLKWKAASGIRQLICCVRRFQRLRLYARCFLVVTCLFIILTAYHFSPLQFSPGWVRSDTCTAQDCLLRDPLSIQKLSPNLLLVLIHASARNREVRDIIRETWLVGLANHAYSPIQYRFVLGGKGLQSTAMDALMKESLEHKDLLIFPTITDSRSSLTNRTLLSLKYAYESFNFKYVLKSDDDSFVDLHRIATELQLRKSAKPLYWGYMQGFGHISHYGRYREFRWDICNSYVPYALGGGYVLSQDITRILARNVDSLKRYTSEDVSVGAWLAPYNIELKHDARFNVNTPSRGCKDPYLISHKINTERMLSYHESLLLEGKMCSWRTYSSGSSGYIYNWTHSNTKECCRPNSFVP